MLLPSSPIFGVPFFPHEGCSGTSKAPQTSPRQLLRPEAIQSCTTIKISTPTWADNSDSPRPQEQLCQPPPPASFAPLLPYSAEICKLFLIICLHLAIWCHFTFHIYLMDHKTYQKCQLLSKDQSENESLFEFLLLLTVCPTFQIRSDAVCDCVCGVCLTFLFGRILENWSVFLVTTTSWQVRGWFSGTESFIALAHLLTLLPVLCYQQLPELQSAGHGDAQTRRARWRIVI